MNKDLQKEAEELFHKEFPFSKSRADGRSFFKYNQASMIKFAILFAQSQKQREPEQLNCDHEWKVDTFDCYGFPTEQYCDKCNKKESI